MHFENSSNILPEPPAELKSVSAKLVNAIQTEITHGGAMPFSRYMEMALYEPGLGYYSAGLKKFGKGGDFVTAPQLGNIFARCLAKQIEQIGSKLASDNGDGYEIIEAGAGTGMLAADLLKALQDGCPPRRYRILERSAHLRLVQKETLLELVPEWMDRISWLDELPAQDWQGVFLANEVLDALTVERFGVEEDGICQMLVRFPRHGRKNPGYFFQS
jgi:SAM-dependent MidA family methyltransferase